MARMAILMLWDIRDVEYDWMEDDWMLCILIIGGRTVGSR